MIQTNHQPVYTHELPYAVRRKLCNLLDADQAWKILAANLGLDQNSITLLGQALMRNSSPTGDLLSKLDSSNARISELFFKLEQINHNEATNLLRPHLNEYVGCSTSKLNDLDQTENCSSLVTPTPSFADVPMLFESLHLPSEYNQIVSSIGAHNTHKIGSPICHSSANKMKMTLNKESGKMDPGEETVRAACASNEKRTSLSEQEVVNQLRLIMQINYDELRVASDDFSENNIIGNGGFASVYRGNWKGTDVAIKRLKCNLVDQALNELTILNSYRIDNILPIYGISIDGPEACLVYQFMSNGSLEDRLSCKDNTQPLTWQQRAMIGEGLAKGLFYLHTLRNKPLVHGDVKSANVLLDSQFVPKLGDFGLARQVFKTKDLEKELCTHCTVSTIHGTSVYLPEEYLRHKILSPAVDVYSYGIVLLEMGTGRRAYDGKRLLVNHVEDRFRASSAGEIDFSLKDSRLTGDTHEGLKIWYELLIRLGLDCAHRIKKKRPDMGQVLTRFVNFRDKYPGYIINNTNNSNRTSPSIPHPIYENHQNIAKYPGANNQEPEYIVPLTNIQQPNYAPAMNAQVAHNSSLMIVEEEQATEGAQQAQPEAEDQYPHMIPLITELGLVGNSK